MYLLTFFFFFSLLPQYSKLEIYVHALNFICFRMDPRSVDIRVNRNYMIQFGTSFSVNSLEAPNRLLRLSTARLMIPPMPPMFA
jgi:hypothetical protein